jgi:hypothetical protein
MVLGRAREENGRERIVEAKQWGPGSGRSVKGPGSATSEGGVFRISLSLSRFDFSLIKQTYIYFTLLLELS